MPLCFAMGPRRPGSGGVGFCAWICARVWSWRWCFREGFAGLVGVELEVVVQFLEQKDFATTVNRTLDVLQVFGGAGALRHAVFFHDKRRVSFGVETLYVLFGGCQQRCKLRMRVDDLPAAFHTRPPHWPSHRKGRPSPCLRPFPLTLVVASCFCSQSGAVRLCGGRCLCLFSSKQAALSSVENGGLLGSHTIHQQQSGRRIHIMQGFAMFVGKKAEKNQRRLPIPGRHRTVKYRVQIQLEGACFASSPGRGNSTATRGAALAGLKGRLALASVRQLTVASGAGLCVSASTPHQRGFAPTEGSVTASWLLSSLRRADQCQ